MTHKKDLNWLKKNHEFLNLTAIARKVGISKWTMHGTIREKADGHGTPFKIPAKYHTALKELIKSIKH